MSAYNNPQTPPKLGDTSYNPEDNLYISNTPLSKTDFKTEYNAEFVSNDLDAGPYKLSNPNDITLKKLQEAYVNLMTVVQPPLAVPYKENYIGNITLETIQKAYWYASLKPDITKEGLELIKNSFIKESNAAKVEEEYSVKNNNNGTFTVSKLDNLEAWTTPTPKEDLKLVIDSNAKYNNFNEFAKEYTNPLNIGFPYNSEVTIKHDVTVTALSTEEKVVLSKYDIEDEIIQDRDW
jgi:hypothetical protein